jgi:dimethylglycine dehydrogenase
MPVKSHVRVLIIGGGAVGCSALYHLAQKGWRDIALTERDELTSGSTWHAAGNCPTFSTSWNVVKLQRYGNALYQRLAGDPAHPIDYHVTGSIRLAHGKARMEELAHVVAMARAQGIGFELIGPNEIKARYPLIELDDIEGGLWDPHDGDIDPSQLTQALARGAREAGAEIYRFNPVIAIAARPDGTWQVTTRNGTINAEIVVNAAGYRAGEIAAMVGKEHEAALPLVSLQHQYLVTDSIPELAALKGRLPLLRDPDVSYYLRQERDALLLGPYEWAAKPVWLDGIPPEFSTDLFANELDRLEPYIEQAIARVPVLGSVGLKRIVNGPIPYSPDGNPYIGPAFGLRNFFNCNSFSFGICQAGGAGKALAEMIVDGEAEWDLWGFDHRRYGAYADRRYVTDKAVELYQNEYAIGFPNEERPAGRPRHVTPLYDRLAAKGAVFGARGGWERAAWFAPAGATAANVVSFQRTNWHEPVGAECRAVAERVGVMDLAGFTKFRVEGSGAAAFLDRLISGALPRIGRVSLAYALTPHGRLLSEFTVTRLAEDRFLLLCAASARRHDWDWLTRHLPSDGTVRLDDASEVGSTLVLAGPRARDVLAALTRADLGNAIFPWLAAREIAVAGVQLLALRVNYVGELGWELHVGMDDLAHVYDALCEAGRPHGIADFGMYAMDSLRLEKGYVSWKQDITTDYDPFEAGLDRFVRLGKGAFIGRAALAERQAGGPAQRLVPLLVDAADTDAPPSSVVFKNGESVGVVGSGGYGHRIGRSIALAYVRRDLAVPGTILDIGILGTMRRATVAASPLYDPGNARLRL